MNAHIDPAVFERRFQRAVREPTSMPCPYLDWDDPANWEHFTDNTKKIPDGEVALVFRSGAVVPYAFRKYRASGDYFERKGGGVLYACDCDTVYVYTGAASHETDICCPNLEDVL